MFKPALMLAFLREICSKKTLPRVPEPNIVMEDPQQVAAFIAAGRVNGIMAAAYQFHTARISQVIQGCKTILDLGCGPATQLCQVASLNQDCQFIGMDLSATMLDDAKKHAKALNVHNVEFREGDITTIENIADHSMDAIISTMTLHHLPDLQHLENCFAAISRKLKPGGALYLTDFGRLKLLKSIIFFAYMNEAHQPHLFSLDYERSLRAAFLKENFDALTSRYLPGNTELISTFKVPILVMIKTGDKPLPHELRARIKAMREDLAPRYRQDLDILRFLFRMGGLKNDPYR